MVNLGHSGDGIGFRRRAVAHRSGSRRASGRNGGKVELRVDVPRGAYVHARTVNGPIRAKDVEGRLSFHAANGEIKVRGAPREARLETINAEAAAAISSAIPTSDTCMGRPNMSSVWRKSIKGLNPATPSA